MKSISISIHALPFMVVAVLAADFPTIPTDLTTPVQQRLAIMGPNGAYPIYSAME